MSRAPSKVSNRKPIQPSSTHIDARLVVVVHRQDRQPGADVHHRLGEQRSNGVVLAQTNHRLPQKVHTQAALMLDLPQQVRHQRVMKRIRFPAAQNTTKSAHHPQQRPCSLKPETYPNNSGTVNAKMQLLKHNRLASLSSASFSGAGPRSTFSVLTSRFQHGSR